MAVKKRGNSPRHGQVRGKAKRIKHGKGTRSTEVVYHSTKEIKVERALIENFIGLQKVMVGLSAKFDNLSSQISNLLQLFELSAKSLARKSVDSPENLDAKRVMEKLDRLSAQAGLIGKGLALIHEVGTETGKPIIPLNVQSKPVPTYSSPSGMHDLQPSILGSEPAHKMTQEVAPEKTSKKIKEPGLNPGVNENVA